MKEKRDTKNLTAYRLSLFSWLTTLLVAIARPLIPFLLALTIGPCLLKCIHNYSTKLLVLRYYNPLLQGEPVI